MKNIYFLFIFLGPIYINAQDTIFRKDSSIHIGKVIKITDNQIKYVKSNNLNEPSNVINKEDVVKISYQNGKVDYFNINPTYRATITIDPISNNFGRKFFSINVFDLTIGFLSIGYEYTFKSGNFSIKIPFSVGFIALNPPDTNEGFNIEGIYYNKSKIFNTGFDFYYYPTGQGKLRYFTGASFEFGQFKYLIYHNNPLSPNTFYLQKENSNYFAFFYQNGLLYQITKNFNISINVGFGYGWQTSSYENTTQFFINGGLNFGYKF